jgi:hypothetical protein
MTGNLIRLFWLVCLFIGTAARAAYNVRDFGAAGDGRRIISPPGAVKL